MLSWEDIVQNYLIKHNTTIKKVTRPLKEHFGIEYFTYHRIDFQGKYTVLLDRPDWAEHYVSEKFYLQDPFLRHPDQYQPGVCVVNETAIKGSEEHLERVVKDGKRFQLDLGVMLIEKSTAGVEFFGFVANKNTSCLETLYLNQPYLLKSFAKHFKKNLNPLLNQMEDEADTLIHLKGNDFFAQQLVKTDVDTEAHLKYLSSLGFQPQIRMAQSLSDREKQCLRLISQGYSAKEIGISLHLSSRTIESYLENIKSKLGCFTKHELILSVQNFKDLGLLP